MSHQYKARIFPASARAHTETEFFRTYNTIISGGESRRNPTPGGALLLLKDQTLDAGRHITEIVQEGAEIFLLPVVGTISCRQEGKEETMISAGEAKIFSVNANSAFEISNPYESGLVTFIQCWLSKPQYASLPDEHAAFNLEAQKNVLGNLFSHNHSLYSTPGPKIFIGKFTGREDFIHTIHANTKTVFAFVIEGAFEVQNRLLEAKDGLALWNLETIEMECLSREGILILIETT